jgi:trans-aconitate methyltransferase
MARRLPQERLAEAYERFFADHGDTFRGVGWTKSQEQTDLRYEVMLGVLRPETEEPVELLDFGCGLAHLYEYLQRRPPRVPVSYSGLEITPSLLDAAKRKFPELPLYGVDITRGTDGLPEFDYVVANGVFTYKDGLDYDEMVNFWCELLPPLFALARVGLAFNAMSKQVDWERDDLFHLPLDVMSSFVSANLSRRFVVRHDYPLFEYTTYVYR